MPRSVLTSALQPRIIKGKHISQAPVGAPAPTSPCPQPTQGLTPSRHHPKAQGVTLLQQGRAPWSLPKPDTGRGTRCSTPELAQGSLLRWAQYLQSVSGGPGAVTRGWGGQGLPAAGAAISGFRSTGTEGSAPQAGLRDRQTDRQRGLGAVRLCWCQALPAFPAEQKALPAQLLTEGWLRRLPGASQCRSPAPGSAGG